MRYGVTRLSVVLAVIAVFRSASAQEPPPASTQPASAPSPWLLVPVFSSSPKLGTALGALGAYLHKFDDSSRVSLFGASYQYTSTNSQVLTGFARTSFGRDHHRVVLIAAFGQIKNDYDDYLGTGQPLKTDDNLKALAGRYLWRAKGDWFIGGQLSAANYQVLGATAEDDLVLETLGVRGANSAGVGANLMHDSRDNEDRPTKGWFMNVNNLAYREAFGGDDSYDAYRADLRAFWKHGGGNVLAVRQYNWLTSGAPSASQATVTLRGYKQGQYLSPYMSSLEVEERWAFNERWGATLFGGVAALYGNAPVELDRTTYPDIGAGVHFVLKPEAHMLVNLEYAQGIGDSRGIYLKLGHAW